MYLVMLETNGNQRFIFSSPRLRENIGASYQVTRLYEWTRDALGISHDSDRWVSRSSGKVIVLAEDEAAARELIRRVTSTAAAQAPGLDVTGVFMPLGEAGFVTSEHLKRIHVIAAQYALERLPSEARFSQIPFLARAEDSTLPASPSLTEMFGSAAVKGEDKADRAHAYSLPSRINRYAAHRSRSQLIDDAVNSDGLGEFKDLLVRDPYVLQEMLQPQDDSDEGDAARLSKVAVIHIDGNGVGAIMSNLDVALRRIPPQVFEAEVARPHGPLHGGARDGSSESDALRRFVLTISQRFENTVRTAFHRAWLRVATVARESDASVRAIPVVPVILGGDDLTVITSGDYALVFAEAYLSAYEDLTSKDPLLQRLSSLDSDGEDVIGPMTAGAGVAIVRRNFPFHIAYDLAERLVKEAKKIGKRSSPPKSTMSFHVLFDTTVLDAASVLSSYASFTKRPYFLRQDDLDNGIGAEHPSWPEVLVQVNELENLFAIDEDSAVSSQGMRLRSFPKRRAARIRKLLSERAVAAAAGDKRRAADREGRAQAEWEEAKTHYAAACDAIGGPEALIDLMELADLLPSAYVHEAQGAGTARSCDPTITIPAAHGENSEVNE